ncbi:hypothetical protein GGS24DRAFT_451333, partial [Hypoxylon argillaceum]
MEATLKSPKASAPDPKQSILKTSSIKPNESDDESSPGSDDSHEDSIFLHSTISKDDTIGNASKKQRHLSQLNGPYSKSSSLDETLRRINHKPPTPPSPHQRPGPPPSRYPLLKVSQEAGWRHRVAGRRVAIASPQDQEDISAGLRPITAINYPHESKEGQGGEYIGGIGTNTGIKGQERMPQGTKADHDIKGSTSCVETNSQSPTSAVETSILAPNSKATSDAKANQNREHEIAKASVQPKEGGLADALSDIAQNHLQINALDESKEAPKYIAYLLDTIDLLESQLRFRLAADHTRVVSVNSQADINVAKTHRGHTLHRIFCTDTSHSHDRIICVDEPTLQSFNGGNPILISKEQISNLSVHLRRHPNSGFVVFKEHDCTPKRKGKSFRVSSERNERIRIVSSLLSNVLKQVADFRLYSRMDEMYGLPEMDAPYLFIYHHRHKLEGLIQQDTHRDVLKPLLDFVYENYMDEYKKADEMLEKGLITPFHFNKLFKPNQMVISRQNPKGLTAAVLNYYPVEEMDVVAFEGWAWGYDGNELYRQDWTGKLDILPDEKQPISALTIHPIEFAKKGDIEQLEKRGQKFWSLRMPSCLRYTGWTETHDYYYNDARFMVDVATYHILHGNSSKYIVPRDTIDPWPSKINRQDLLPPNAARLLPLTIYGFSLSEKKWVVIFVQNLLPVDWNKKAFERLVLEPRTKEMIYALVDVQARAVKMDDIITGKGNGLIVLLHGSPGTGKTLTAESVAEIAEKPLYRVTCGDIGTQAEQVEKYLESVMYLGKLWDCVLLLDEADVFLEERTMADLQRNSLVSVFLRILEYYDGILILTSNRVGTFDEAFKSRIQVAIHYDKLTKKSRRQIWCNFFDMIEEKGEDANIPELERRLDELASEEMNGRQIRNALLTARQLAKHRDERLDWPHLSQVMKTSAAFNKYLKAIKGHSDEQWAREEQL